MKVFVLRLLQNSKFICETYRGFGLCSTVAIYIKWNKKTMTRLRKTYSLLGVVNGLAIWTSCTTSCIGFAINSSWRIVPIGPSIQLVGLELVHIHYLNLNLQI
jgi:hypothetical protein